MTDLKSGKTAGMSAYKVLVVTLFLLVFLIPFSKAADLKPEGIATERRTSAAESKQSPSKAKKGDTKTQTRETRGTLKRSGNKVSLRLNHPAARVEVFSENRKLAVLGSGRDIEYSKPVIWTWCASAVQHNI